MAGGMSKRGSTGMPMSQRVSAAVPDAPDALDAPRVEECPARHCWVLDPADGSHVRRPGLLVEWRRSSVGAWEGRIAYAASLRAGEWAVVEEWVPAVLVRSA